MKIGLAIGLGLAIPTLSCAQEIDRMHDVFRGLKSAYALWPPEFVTANGVEWAEWSPSGRAILGKRTSITLNFELVRCSLLGLPATVETKVQTSLFVWDRQERKASTLWQVSDVVQSELFQWIGRADVALVLATGHAPGPDGAPAPTQELLLADVGHARVREIFKSNLDGTGPSIVDLQTTPFLPYAVLTTRALSNTASLPNGEWFVSIVKEDGKLLNPVQLPAGVLAYAAYVDPVTHQGYIRGISRTKPESGAKSKAVFNWLSMNPITGAVTPCNPPKKDVVPIRRGGPEKRSEPRVEPRVQAIGEGTAARRIDMVWLCADGVPEQRGRPSAALVCADSPYAALSPQLDNVLYISGGALFIRRVQPISLDEFEQSAQIGDRREIIANAKQVGLALLMYAADSDDNLPGKDGLGDLLMPYLKDGGLMSGFVYTFGGGNMNNIESPATTEMGYISGNGGRAVVYTDGHVRWLKNP